jgi:hypothetical protein
LLLAATQNSLQYEFSAIFLFKVQDYRTQLHLKNLLFFIFKIKLQLNEHAFIRIEAKDSSRSFELVPIFPSCLPKRKRPNFEIPLPWTQKNVQVTEAKATSIAAV